MASSVEKAEAECAKDVGAPPPRVNYFAVDVGLRFLLFAAAVSSVVVMVTSNQTITKQLRAKFNDSTAFIYFVAALSLTALYSLITLVASVSVISKPNLAAKFLLHLALWDVLILGVVASATGTAGGVAYIGLKGNTHVQWRKVCHAFDKFCSHVGGALAASLFASVVLVLLIWLSVFSLHARIRK